MKLKQKCYIQYFITIILSILVVIFGFNKKNYDFISIILLVLLYVNIIANIVFVIKALMQKDKNEKILSLEMLSIVMTWVVSLIALLVLFPSECHDFICIDFKVPDIIFIFYALGVRYIVFPLSLFFMIYNYFVLYIKKKKTNKIVNKKN